MKKKIIYCSALTAVFAASAAFAGGPEMIPVAPNYFNGFFIGGTGALHHTNFDGDSDLVLNEPVTTVPFTTIAGQPLFLTLAPAGTVQSNDISASSIDGYGGVQGGFGKVFDHRWYLGVVGFGEWGSQEMTSSANNSVPLSSSSGGIVIPGVITIPAGLFTTNDNTSSTQSTTVTVNNDYGVAFKPGFLLTPTTMMYGKIGVIWANIKVKNTATVTNDSDVGVHIPADILGLENPSVDADLSIDTFSSGSASNEETKTGLLLGGGFEQFIYKDIMTINVEYDYANYGSVSVTNNLTSTATDALTLLVDGTPVSVAIPADLVNPPSITSHASANVRVSTLLAGLNFYFGSNWF